ncbi:MAG: peptide ABC transporter substrate-binding protein [Tumebacillaceae bacterium]
MMRTTKWLNVGLAVTLLATTTLVGCSSSSTTSEKTADAASQGGGMDAVQELNLIETDEIPTMDASLASDTISLNVLGQTMEGLIHLDKDGKASPGVATSWDISPDGLTYTFHLRDDAFWSNGDKVTAKDFEYSFKRTLDPKTKSEYAFMMAWLKGVKAIDDKTLEITLEIPRPYFLTQMAFPTFYPENQKVVEQYGDKYGGDADKNVYNGPFKLTSWTHDQSWTLEKNDKYWDAKNVKLQKVNYQVVKDSNVALNMYESNQIDRMGLVREQIDLYKDSPEKSTELSQGVYYLMFNNTNKALANKKIRQALTYAIDKQQIVDVALNNGSMPATSLTPKGTSDTMDGDYTKDLGDAIKAQDNASKAKQLLEEGLKEIGETKLPKIVFTNDDSTNGRKLCEFFQEVWRQKLGIEVEVENIPLKALLQKTQQHSFDILFSGWNPDYDDAMTYLGMWTTNSDYNSVQWSNPKYDELIAAANKETEKKKRIQQMQDAERILMDELPIAPLFWPGVTLLTRPYVKNWAPRKTLPSYDLKYTYIEGKK